MSAGPGAPNPNFPNLMKSSRDTVLYETARSTVQYDTLPYDIMSDADMIAAGYTDANSLPDESSWKRYVEVLPKSRHRHISLEGGTMMLAGSIIGSQQIPGVGQSASGTAIRQGATGIILSVIELEVRHHALPANAVPSASVNPYLQANNLLGVMDTFGGTVNLNQWLSFAPGTLLYLHGHAEPHRGQRGDRLYDVFHFFEWSPIYPWNLVPFNIQQKLQWMEISTDGQVYGPTSVNDKVHIYNSRDHRFLLKVP